MREPIQRLFTQCSVALIILFLVVWGIDIFAQSFVVSRFRNLYRDALPGQPLPPVTHFILNHQFCLVALPVVLLLVAVWVIFRARHLWLAAIFSFIAIQIAVTVIALFMPMVVDITGMQAPR